MSNEEFVFEDTAPIKNFATGKTDNRPVSLPLTDEEAVQYIPQDAVAQRFYHLCRRAGDSVDDAMMHVLRKHLGI